MALWQPRPARGSNQTSSYTRRDGASDRGLPTRHPGQGFSRSPRGHRESGRASRPLAPRTAPVVRRSRRCRPAIWITPRFSDEHRQALIWLNESTTEGIRFFGVEVSVEHIGASPPAPWWPRRPLAVGEVVPIWFGVCATVLLHLSDQLAGVTHKKYAGGTPELGGLRRQPAKP